MATGQPRAISASALGPATAVAAIAATGGSRLTYVRRLLIIRLSIILLYTQTVQVFLQLQLTPRRCHKIDNRLARMRSSKKSRDAKLATYSQHAYIETPLQCTSHGQCIRHPEKASSTHE